MLPPKGMGTVTYIAPPGNYTIQVRKYIECSLAFVDLFNVLDSFFIISQNHI